MILVKQNERLKNKIRYYNFVVYKSKLVSFICGKNPISNTKQLIKCA